MVAELAAMSTDDRTRDKDLGLAKQLSEEGGLVARSKWEGYKQMANKFKEEGKVVMELYYCKLLADCLMLAAQNIGQADVEEGVAKCMVGADVTWKETTYWVHRWVKRVLEQKGGNNPVVKRPEFHDMRCNLVLACSRQLRLSRFDEVIETADLFLEVKPVEETREELQVQLMKGVARNFLGSPAAVKDFDIAVRLAQKVDCIELEAEAWYGKGSSLRKTNRHLYKEDIDYCFTKYEELISQVPNGRAHVDALFATHPRSFDHQQENIPEIEIQRLEKELAGEDQSPISLAGKHLSLGRLFFQQKEFLKAEESLKQAIKQWRSTPVIENSGSMYQVTAQLLMAPAFQLLQLCLAEQGKPLEALMWAERARARTLRYALLRHAAGYEDEFEEDDKLAQERIMAALSSCKGSVVAVEYSFVQTNLLIWVLKPGLPPTIHQVSLNDIDFPCQDKNLTSLETMELYLTKLLTLISTSSFSDKATKNHLSVFYKLLIEPIKQELTGCDTIVFIPIQALHRLPWTALIDEHQKDGEKYLIQRYAVAIAPSLLALAVCSQNLAKNMSKNDFNHDEILVVANPWPLSLPKLPSLSGTVAEAAAIVKLVKAYTGLEPRVYMGKDANRETVIENLPRAKWVHMACHNIVNKNYNAGALILACAAMSSAVASLIPRYSWCEKPEDASTHQLPTGTMFHTRTNLASLVGEPMDEISSRDEMIRGVISAQQLTHCKLQAHGVVLSACSSSEGVLIGEEGILGLARALLVAGAPAVLLSLWNTRDVETNKLMTQVYKNLITGRDPKTGLPYNLAFAHRQAILSMIGMKDIQVSDWAVFQIFGTPEVIFPGANQSGRGQKGFDGCWALQKCNSAILIPLVIAFCCILVAILSRLSTTEVHGEA